MTPTSDDIRRRFIDYFRARPAPGAGGHTFTPSSPVVPVDDPTLLFTNAGMNQFKPIFLGTVDPASPLAALKRAVNTQKCIRAGGKHNDLEDVGKDTYHHTFFEMLGNWSFGDYFKAESIAWGFEFLTKTCGIPANRLYATYFKGDPASGLEPDTEARDLWLRHLPPGHVLPGNMKDNFWEMGETGPCGPCSEVHYDRIGDRNAAPLVNTGDPDVIEIWNHVFIQFNREAGEAPSQPGKLRPLPARHVDTGMGFERLVSVIQNVRSNYDTDIFAPIFAAIERITGARPYMGRLGAADVGHVDTAYRVIADHIRALTFAITDGAVPSNEGRGYVLRRILRRAVRFGRQMLNAKTGFFHQLVPVVVEKMSAAFPELKHNPPRVIDIIREEEESFGRTLDRGIKLFEEAEGRAIDRAANHKDVLDFAQRKLIESGHVKSGTMFYASALSDWTAYSGPNRPTISADDAFKLYDTYGFPIDLTVLMAEERGLKVDTAGYEKLMATAKDRSRAGGKDTTDAQLALGADAVVRLKRMGVDPTDDNDKFHGRTVGASVRAIWSGSDFDETVRSDTQGLRPVGVILDKTNFYAEMGGQVTDHGRMTVTRESRAGSTIDTGTGEFRVDSVRAFGGYVLHIGLVTRGELRVGDNVQLHVDQARRQPVAANHTATHLLNFALRKVLGPGVDQKGSLVAPDRFRFDFSNTGPVAPPQLAEVENIVRNQIELDLTVYADVAPLYVAKTIAGLRAVFGETYPDPVRVVSIGQPVTELIANPENAAWNELSVEFCGGTHLPSTRQAGAFALVSEEAVAKGVRRVTGLTGVAARAAIQSADNLASRIDAAARLEGDALQVESAQIATDIDQMTIPVSRKDELRKSLAGLKDRVRAAQKQASDARKQEAVVLARRIAESAEMANDHVIISTIHLGSDRGALEQAVKTIRDKCPRSAVMLLSPDETDPAGPKVSIMAGVPETIAKRGLHAGEWVREAASVVGGKGGGRPDAAQGGGTEVERIKDAVASARSFAHKRLSGP